MSIWTRRAILLVTIGCSFAGLSSFFGFVATALQSQLPLIFSVVWATFLIWGIAIGIAFAEGRTWHRQLLAYLAAQVPYVTLPQFQYHNLPGLQLVVGVIKEQFKVSASFGVDFSITVGPEQEFGLAISVLPLILIIAILRSNHLLERTRS
jgi:hypothetical protein